MSLFLLNSELKKRAKTEDLFSVNRAEGFFGILILLNRHFLN